MRTLLALVLLACCTPVHAAVIFSEDYDDVASWNCSQGAMDGWSSLANCPSADTYDGATHYAGEVSTGGRAGNSFKQWRRNGTDWIEYHGFQNYSFSSSEFSNNHRVIYSRMYIKFPVGWSVTDAGGDSPKIIGRMYGGTSTGGQSEQIYVGLYEPSGTTNIGNRQFKFTPSSASGTYSSPYVKKTMSELGIMDGEWHCLEIGVDLGTYGQANGKLLVYLDGTLLEMCDYYGNNVVTGITNIQYNWANNVYITYPFTPGLGNTTGGEYNFPQNTWYALEFDDYVVSTTYVGPVEGGSDITCYKDSDGDGYSDGTSESVESCSSGYYEAGDLTATSGDCDDTSAAVNPGASEVCGNAVDNDCNGLSGCDDTACIGETACWSVVLNDGFESGNDNNWECDYLAGDSSVVTSTPSPQAGTYSFKQPSSDSGNIVHGFGDHSECASGTLVDDIKIDSYIYLQTGFQWPSSDLKFWIINSFLSWSAGCSEANNSAKPHAWAPYYLTIAGDGDGDLFGQLVRADGLVTNGSCSTSVTDGALWTNYVANEGTAKLQAGQWNHVVVRAKLNTIGEADGLLQIWVNDTLVAAYDEMNYRGSYAGTGWNHLISSFHANPSHPQSQYRGLDSVLIYSGTEANLGVVPIGAPTGAMVIN